MAIWAFFGKSKSFVPSLVLFYIVRGIAVNVGRWPLPTHCAYLYPEFPSLTIQYRKTNDLYFSGHTGICLLMLSDSALNGKKTQQIFSFFLLFATVSMLLVLQWHYVNDVIIAMVMALLSSKLCFKYQYEVTLLSLDRLTASLDFLKKIFGSKKFEEKQSLAMRGDERKKSGESPSEHRV